MEIICLILIAIIAMIIIISLKEFKKNIDTLKSNMFGIVYMVLACLGIIACFIFIYMILVYGLFPVFEYYQETVR